MAFAKITNLLTLIAKINYDFGERAITFIPLAYINVSRAKQENPENPEKSTAPLPKAICRQTIKLIFMRKQFILFFGAVLLTACATAQKSSFGIQAGVGVGNMVFKFDDFSMNADGKVGVTFGVVADIPLSNNFGFRPSLDFVQKGLKYSESDMGFTYSSKTSVNYLEVPLNFVYTPSLPNLKPFFGAGPSFAFALSGKAEENDNGIVDKYDLEFGDDPDADDMKGFDIGVNFLAGLQLKQGFVFSFNYTLGVANLVPGGDSEDGTIKNRYFAFKIGYMFGAKK